MTVLRTARLTLRPFTADDIDAYAAIRADPEVLRHLPGGEAKALSAVEDAGRIVPAFAAAWGEVGYGPWAAIGADGDLLGHLGLRFLPEFGQTEVLYMLARRAWGRGLATEGAVAARDHAFRVLGLPRLVGMVRPDNAASAAVLRRIGMREDGRIEAWGMQVVRFVLDADAGSGQGA